MDHFEGNVYRCTGCHKDIHVPHNQVGGFWWLSGWEDKNGVKMFGGFCSSCFTIMDKEKRGME